MLEDSVNVGTVPKCQIKCKGGCIVCKRTNESQMVYKCQSPTGCPFIVHPECFVRFLMIQKRVEDATELDESGYALNYVVCGKRHLTSYLVREKNLNKTENKTVKFWDVSGP